MLCRRDARFAGGLFALYLPGLLAVLADVAVVAAENEQACSAPASLLQRATHRGVAPAFSDSKGDNVEKRTNVSHRKVTKIASSADSRKPVVDGLSPSPSPSVGPIMDAAFSQTANEQKLASMETVVKQAVAAKAATEKAAAQKAAAEAAAEKIVAEAVAEKAAAEKAAAEKAIAEEQKTSSRTSPVEQKKEGASLAGKKQEADIETNAKEDHVVAKAAVLSKAEKDLLTNLVKAATGSAADAAGMIDAVTNETRIAAEKNVKVVQAERLLKEAEKLEKEAASASKEADEAQKEATNAQAGAESATEDQLCHWKRPARCVASFVYKGKTFDQCVSENGGLPWCSHASNYSAGKGWSHCSYACESRSRLVQMNNSAEAGLNGTLNGSINGSQLPVSGAIGIPLAGAHPNYLVPVYIPAIDLKSHGITDPVLPTGTPGTTAAPEDPTSPAATVSLDESGYTEIAAVCDTTEMSRFVRRVITRIGCKITDELHLAGFAPWYSGEADVQTFSKLDSELRCLCTRGQGPLWLEPIDPDNPPTGGLLKCTGRKCSKHR